MLFILDEWQQIYVGTTLFYDARFFFYNERSVNLDLYGNNRCNKNESYSTTMFYINHSNMYYRFVNVSRNKHGE